MVLCYIREIYVDTECMLKLLTYIKSKFNFLNVKIQIEFENSKLKSNLKIQIEVIFHPMPSLQYLQLIFPWLIYKSSV